jgi:hypothetical protein
MKKNHGNEPTHIKASMAGKSMAKKLKAESIKPAHNNMAKKK